MTNRSSLWVLGSLCVGMVAANAAADPEKPGRVVPATTAAAPDTTTSLAVPQVPTLLALRRSDYHTSSPIALRATAWDVTDPAAGELSLQLQSGDGSRVRALFQPMTRPAGDNVKIDPEGPLLSPWLLRPGRYAVTVNAGARTAAATFELHSAIRRSSYQVIDAGFDAAVGGLAPRGEDGLGFNLLFPDAERFGVRDAWTRGTEPLLTATPPGEGVLPGLWVPAITDPLRRAKDLSDGSSMVHPASWFGPLFQSQLHRARDRSRPAVCLPETSPRDAGAWQLERNLAFASGGTAVVAAPIVAEQAAADPLAAQPPSVIPARLLETVTASNKLAARLGTVFTAMPAARASIAVLIPPNGGELREEQRILMLWLAARTLQHRVDFVTPDDVVDGVVARHHKVLIVATSGPLDGLTTGVLERYVQAGGLVVLPDDTAGVVPGGLKLGMGIDLSHFAGIEKLLGEGKQADAARLRRPSQVLRAVEPLARALRAKFDAASVFPPLTSDLSTVFVSRHGYGDVEYFFAVNCTPDDTPAADTLAPKVATATLSFRGVTGTIYDAISSQPATRFAADGDKVSAAIRFGAGQMRVFARTARPIGSVKVGTPQVVSDYDSPLPLRLELAASLLDSQGQVLNGAVPLRIRVTDSLGTVRYDLWRSSDRGLLRLDLPLAANDPAGPWTVSVQEMLSLKSGESTFEYRPPTQIGVIAEWPIGFDEARGQPRRYRPVQTSVAAASKVLRAGEAPVLWRASMPDRVVSIQAVRQKLTIFSHDGTASQLDSKGAVLSQEPAPVIASPRPPEPLPPAVAENALKDRTVKRSATEAGLTAVGYWGGVVQVFGPDGTLRSQQVLPSGIADLIWFDGSLIVGLSDGEVLALRTGGQ